jgi:hypothetical protein
MTTFRLRHIHQFRDRHGKLRRYVRIPGRKSVPLLGSPGSEEFMQAYHAALADAPKTEIGASRTLPGSVSAAIASFLGSAAFQAGAPDTRRTRRNILERFRIEHGDKRIALLQRHHIEQMVAAKSATPSMARCFISALHALMQHCVVVGLRADDPTIGVKRPVIKATAIGHGPRTTSPPSRRGTQSARAPGSRWRS